MLTNKQQRKNIIYLVNNNISLPLKINVELLSKAGFGARKKKQLKKENMLWFCFIAVVISTELLQFLL